MLKVTHSGEAEDDPNGVQDKEDTLTTYRRRSPIISQRLFPVIPLPSGSPIFWLI